MRPSAGPTADGAAVRADAAAPGDGAAPADGADRPASRAGGRDRYLDFWRAAALVRVVTYHVFGWIWLTVLFPAMGLMFALAGSLMASSLDRSGRGAVGRRLRRLLPPLWGFGAVAVTLLLVTGWGAAPAAALGWGELVWWVFPARTPPVGSQSWAWAYNVVLWYLVTYLWLVLLSPLLLAVFRRWPWRSLAVAVALPFLALFGVFNIGGYFNEQATNVSTYLACWLLGFAHHDGLLRRIPARRYALGVLSLALVGAGWVVVVGWSSGNFDLNRMPGGNTLWSVAFVATVLRFRPRLDWLGRIQPLDRVVQLLNARAVTVYLWHLPAGVLVNALLSPVRLPGWLANVAVRLAFVWLLIAVAVGLFGWIEDLAARRRPALLPARVGPRVSVPRPASGAVRPAVPSGPAAPRPAASPRPAAAGRAGSPRHPVTVWHRAMASTVAVLAVGLGFLALNLWPGVTTRAQHPQAQPEVTYYLSDLPLLLDDASASGSGAAQPQPRTTPGGVTVRGEIYPRAVLTAAPSRLRVQPPAGCERLRAVIDVGADDVQVAFAVRADDVTVFDSGTRSRSDRAEQIDVDVARASYVDLVTSSSSGGAVGVWADPRFVCVPAP
ncbi:acyltransferase family protein [Plantactinospora sp. CA-290183]|uniref:acyltransferase family protein n=1 Tax=Plantactinospora sp. CA-290183 TaxID=3240006 RepID=UPI003D945FD6